MKATPAIPPVIAAALADAKRRLAAALGSRLREVRLFGSNARGEATADSDIDLFVLVDRIANFEDRFGILDVVAGVSVEHALPIETVVMGEDELERLRRYETGFARAIDQEGIVL